MDRQRLGQKKKGNRNQQGSNKGRGGKRPGFVTKNRLGGNAGPKGKGGRRGNIGGGGRQGSGGGIKTKTTTITRTVNDLRQLIRPKAGEKTGAKKTGAKNTSAKVTMQNKKSSIKKRLGLQSKSARAATVQARRNVTTTAPTRMEMLRGNASRVRTSNNTAVLSRNQVWRRKDPLGLTQTQPVAPTVIITQAPVPLASTVGGSGSIVGGRSKVRGNSVVISNLKAGITHKDVEDLFGDIGPASVQMIDSHTAIVTYADPNHAARSVDVYHNRLLDGYPMQCTLIPAANVATSQPSTGFVSRTMRQIFS